MKKNLFRLAAIFCVAVNICYADWTDYWQETSRNRITPKAIMTNNLTQNQFDDAVQKLSTYMDTKPDRGEVKIDLGRKFLYRYQGEAADLSAISANVVKIGINFGKDAVNLRAFSTLGLNKVTVIQPNFLFGATSLESLDTRGLTNVLRIKDDFLKGTTSLLQFTGEGLRNVRAIEQGFLFKSGLSEFKATYLNSVRTIGQTFLFAAPNLKDFDSSGFDSLRNIGDYFISQAPKLETFVTDGFEQVKVIGCSFLFSFGNNSKLIDFDPKILRNLVELGDNFLGGYQNQGLFEMPGTVERIGTNYLGGVRTLQNLDSSTKVAGSVQRFALNTLLQNGERDNGSVVGPWTQSAYVYYKDPVTGVEVQRMKKRFADTTVQEENDREFNNFGGYQQDKWSLAKHPNVNLPGSLGRIDLHRNMSELTSEEAIGILQAHAWTFDNGKLELRDADVLTHSMDPSTLANLQYSDPDLLQLKVNHLVLIGVLPIDRFQNRV